MVAYSFQTRFVQPILDGTKGGTIRTGRRNPPPMRAPFGGHAKPGEMIQLYTGMRTKHCRRITDRRCIAVEPIELNFYLRRIWFPESNVTIEGRNLNAFAVFDGFTDFDEMEKFWHPGAGPFEGWHIRWMPLCVYVR